MEESNTVVIRARAADEERAKQILFQYTDKDFSFADAISFSVMERLAIRHAFSFDRDFAQYGFTVLPGRSVTFSAAVLPGTPSAVPSPPYARKYRIARPLPSVLRGVLVSYSRRMGTLLAWTLDTVQLLTDKAHEFAL